MEVCPNRFAIVIHPPDYDVAELVTRLATSDFIPVHVMPYEQWEDTANHNNLELLFVRFDGSWRCMPGPDDRSAIHSEIRDYYRSRMIEVEPT